MTVSVTELSTLIALADDTSPECSFADFTLMQSAFEACLNVDVMRKIVLQGWLAGKDLRRYTTEDRRIIWRKGDCGLIIKYISANATYPDLLNGMPGHRFIGLVDGGTQKAEATLDLLVGRHDSELDPELFDPEITISTPIVHQLRPGSSIALEGYWDFLAHIPNASASDQIYLTLIWQPHHRYRWDVSIDSLRPKRIVSVDESALRTASVASVLGRLPAAGNAHTLQRLLGHPDHNVRWEAVRSLFKLDKVVGLTHLQVLAECDPNIQLRETAKVALVGVDRTS